MVALDGRVLVLFDSRDAGGRWARATLAPALRHLGIAHWFGDVAGGLPSDATLAGAAAILISQDGLTGDLGESGCESILRAVKSGVGLVSLDGMLNTAPAKYCEAVGVKSSPGLERRAATHVRIAADTHWITRERPREEELAFRRPVRAVSGRLDEPSMPLVTDEAGRPVMWTFALGQGRIVQWSIPPTVWAPETLGFGFGLDDLFWRGIAWAARKPFVTMALPPFTRLRFDDCQGLWRNAEDFGFVDVLNAHGHVPSLFVCLSAITDSGARRMRELVADGKAEFSPHVLRPNVGLYLGDDTHTYSAAEIQANFRAIDERFKTWGIPIAPVIADHNHEYSSLAVREFAARGMRYRINVTAPDEHWHDEHRDWHPAPYDLTSYAIDEIPRTGIVAVLNHFTPFMYARTQTTDDTFVFDRDGSFGEVIWDFLNGLAGEGWFDVAASVGRFALHERRALQGGFVGGSISHSHWMRYLNAPQLDNLLTGVDEENRKVERRPVSATTSAQRADDHRRLTLADVRIEQSRVAVRIEGDPEVIPELRVYREGQDGEVNSSWVTIAADRDGRAIVGHCELEA